MHACGECKEARAKACSQRKKQTLQHKHSRRQFGDVGRGWEKAGQSAVQQSTQVSFWYAHSLWLLAPSKTRVFDFQRLLPLLYTLHLVHTPVDNALGGVDVASAAAAADVG